MNESGITIRAATDDDKDAVLALAPRLAEGLPPWRNAGEALAAGRRWLEDSLAAAATAGDAAVFVAADRGATRGAATGGAASPGVADGGVAGSGTVVGVISVRVSRHFTGERDGYIGELVVARCAARRGIGSALIAAAEGWGRERGLANLTLHTGAFNNAARWFYAALGFAEEELRLTRAVPPRAQPGAHLPE